MKKLFLAVLMACVYTACLFSKDIEIKPELLSMSIECPGQVAVGDTFKVVYKLSYPENLKDKDMKIRLSNISKNVILSGRSPETSIESVINVKNEKTITNHSIKWTYVFRAEKPGMFVTPSYTISCGNERLSMQSKSKKIEIKKDGIKKDKTNPRVIKKVTTRVLVRLELDKNRMQLGDSAILKVAVLTDNDISNCIFFNLPMIEDCFMEELPSLDSIESEDSVESIDGENYTKWIVAVYKIIPLKRGNFTINPIRFKGENNKEIDITDIFSPHAISTESFEVKSNRLKFKVE